MVVLLKKMSWSAKDMESGVSTGAQWGEYMDVSYELNKMEPNIQIISISPGEDRNILLKRLRLHVNHKIDRVVFQQHKV
jgi:hypothetical protein